MKNILIITSLLITLISFSGNCNSPKVALHYSYAAEIISPEKSLEKITYWEIFFLNNRIRYDVIYDDDIKNGISTDDYHIIFFINAILISDESFNSITKFIESGGGIIIIGEFGHSDEFVMSERARQFQILSGISISGNVPRDLISSFVRIEQFLPITLDILPGKVIQVSTRNSPPIIDILNHGAKVIGKFKYQKNNSENDQSAIIYSPLGNGRLFWCAFDPMDIIGGKDDKENFDKMMKNIISLFSGEELIWIEQSRALNPKELSIVFDLSGNIKQAENILSKIEKHSLEPGFILSINEDKSDLIKILSDAGEIILKISSQDLVHANKDDNDYGYLRASFNRFQDITGRKISSVDLDNSKWNNDFYKSLLNYGIRNLLVSGNENPEVESFSLHLIKTSDVVFKDLIKQIDHLDHAPVLKFKFKPGCFDEDLFLIDKILVQLKSGNYKLVPIIDYLSWVDIRYDLSASMNVTGSNKLEVQVVNRNNRNSGKFEVGLSSIGIRNAVECNVSFQEVPIQYQFDTENNFVKIFVDNLSANRLINFVIELN
ncbi:MAG: hypothetical protein R6W68_04360 [Ignavibacteriaceae bacterium]